MILPKTPRLGSDPSSHAPGQDGKVLSLHGGLMKGVEPSAHVQSGKFPVNMFLKT